MMPISRKSAPARDREVDASRVRLLSSLTEAAAQLREDGARIR